MKRARATGASSDMQDQDRRGSGAQGRPTGCRQQPLFHTPVSYLAPGYETARCLISKIHINSAFMRKRHTHIHIHIYIYIYIPGNAPRGHVNGFCDWLWCVCVHVCVRKHAYVCRTMCMIVSLILPLSLSLSAALIGASLFGTARTPFVLRRSCGRSDPHSSGPKPDVLPQCISTACLVIPIASSFLIWPRPASLFQLPCGLLVRQERDSEFFLRVGLPLDLHVASDATLQGEQ